MTRKTILAILMLVLISRTVMLFTGYVGMNMFASFTKPPVYGLQPPADFPAFAMKLPEELSDTKLPSRSNFSRFDSYNYLKIATQGYDGYLFTTVNVIISHRIF